MKPKILITRNLDENIVQPLGEKYDVDMWEHEDIAIPRDELLTRARGASGILCMLTDRIDTELLDATREQLQTISTMSVGYNHVDVDALKERGITLGYTPEVLNDTVADTTVMLMLNAGRRAAEAARAVKNGEWGTWSPYWMTGHDLSGSTVGLVGMGSIAADVAKRLSGFGCRVVYHSRSPKPEYEQALGVERMELDQLLEVSDFVSLHAPLTDTTRGMFDEEKFGKMKPSAVFVNTSRGELVNQNDLHKALSTDQIFAAGLDVTTPEPLPTDSPLLELKNCLVLPHIGSASIRTRVKMTEIAVRNLVAGIENTDFVSQLKMD